MSKNNILKKILSNIKNYSKNGLSKKLKCYPRKCLCSQNIKRFDDKTNNIWKQYLKNNDTWCPYNTDGSKKNLPYIVTGQTLLFK
jgi:hypothetical protein